MFRTIERNSCAENEILEMEKLIKDFESSGKENTKETIYRLLNKKPATIQGTKIMRGKNTFTGDSMGLE